GKERGKPPRLLLADAAGCQEGGGGNGGGDPDQRDVALPLDEGEGGAVASVAPHPRGPELAEAAVSTRHVSVMVAWNDGDEVRGTELLQPKTGVLEFLLGGYVGEVTGDRDVVRPLLLEIEDQAFES